MMTTDKIVDCSGWKFCAQHWGAHKNAKAAIRQSVGDLDWRHALADEERAALRAPGTSIRDTGYSTVRNGWVRRFGGLAVFQHEGRWLVAMGYPTKGTPETLYSHGGIVVAPLTEEQVDLLHHRISTGWNPC